MVFQKTKLLLVGICIFSVFIYTSFCDIVVHVQNPWADDPERKDSPLYIFSEEPGWYPGEQLTSEGGDWYCYRFVSTPRSSNQRIEIASVIPTQYDRMANRILYPQSGDPQLNLGRIFSSNPQAKEVWITINSPDASPVFHFTPPKSKVIAFYNPWEKGFPELKIENMSQFVMRRMPEYCGWFIYNYFGDLEDVNVKMINNLNKNTFSNNGMEAGDYINITEALTANDTIWIYPDPLPNGAPSIDNVFPGLIGDCGLITLAVTLRDKGYGNDFGTDNCDGKEKVTRNLVAPRLGANGKPVKTASNCLSDSFFNWFIPQDLGNGYTNEVCQNITLEKNAEGLYEYDSDAFFPLDSFEYLDEAGKIANPNYTLQGENNGPKHNFWFTMELGAKFEYVPGQTFYFRGDDDVWVYIDSQLEVDLGGLHSAAEGSVNLDELSLTPGDTYSFKLFFAERKCCNSNFRVVTSINLRSSSNLYYDKDSSSNIFTYHMKEKRTKDNLSCNSDGEIVDTVNANVLYYIQGPSFPVPYQLKPGKHFGDSIKDIYGLIIVSTKDSSVLRLDTANFSGVLPGDYVITYYSSNNRSQTGKIPFTIYEVPKPPRIPNPVVKAAYYANNPYGQVDLAEIYFKNVPTTIPDSVELYWPDNSHKRVVYKKRIVQDTSNVKHFTLYLETPFQKEITSFLGANKPGYCYSTDTTFSNPHETVTVNFADSVGPLIKNAILLQRVINGMDTLLLTFTEPLKDNSIIGNTLNLLKSGNSYKVKVHSCIPIADTLKVLVSTEENVSFAYGDSLQIISAGTLTDLYNNHAHIKNRPVPVIIRKSPANILKAFYMDKNADGIVDQAQIEFDREVDIKDIKASFMWINDNSTNQLSSERIKQGKSAQIITVNLEKAFKKSVTNITSKKMNVSIFFDSFTNIERWADVEDSAAAVLVSARYAPAIITENSKNEPDTLYATFSEEIILPFTTDEPLTFKKPGENKPYQVKLQFEKIKSSEHVLKILSIKDGVYPEKADSVWINPDAKLSDLNLNKQINSLNSRVLLSVRSTPIKFRFRVGPNPFKPSQQEISIIIDPSLRTREEISIEADVNIFDPIGNVIFHAKENKLNENSEIEIKWDGTNRSGRIVTDGTYLLEIIAINLKTGEKQPAKFLIGAKK